MAAKPPRVFNERRLFLLNEPETLRISPALAEEIGLNESILFLQLEFWIATQGKEHDGRRWFYASVRHLAARLRFWSFATINRTIKALIDRGLVVEGNYNAHGYDRTRWLAIDLQGAAQLRSVAVKGVDTPLCQNDTPPLTEPAPLQIDAPLCQDDTSTCQGDTPMCQVDTGVCQDDTSTCQDDTSTAQNDTTIPESLESIRESSGEESERGGEAENDPLPLDNGGPCPENPPMDGEEELVPEGGPSAPAVARPTICLAARHLEEVGHVTLLPVQVERIRREVTDLVQWRRVVRRWLEHDYKPRNVAGLLDWYRHPEKMHAQCHDVGREEAAGVRRERFARDAERYGVKV
jgi:hypothetical protein